MTLAIQMRAGEQIDQFGRNVDEKLAAVRPLLPPDLVIADIARVDPDEVADAYPEVPILGFTNHTDTSGLRRAHEAGFDQVVVKSALTERAKDLVEELTA